MKDATAPLANGDDKIIKTTEHAGNDSTNGGSPRPPSALTNGHSGKNSKTGESGMNVDAYENSLLQNSDSSDSENLNLELELSDEETVESSVNSAASAAVNSSRSVTSDEEAAEGSVHSAASAAVKSSRSETSEVTVISSSESDASTIVFSSKGKSSEVVDGAQVTPTTQDNGEKPVEAENATEKDAESEERGSSDVEIVSEGSEAIIDPKSSTNASSDAATDSISKSEDACRTSKETKSQSEDFCSDGANDLRTGVSDNVEVDDAGAKIAGIEEGSGRPRTESEVGGRLESESGDTRGKGLSERPEVQVIDIDDSSSESSKAEIEFGSRVAVSGEAATKLDSVTCCESDGLLRQASNDLLEATLVKEKSASEVLGCSADDVREKAGDLLENSLESPERDGDKSAAELANADSIVDGFEAKNTGCDEDKLGFEKADERVHEGTSKNTTSELADEPDKNLIADKSEYIVESIISEVEESDADKAIAEGGVLATALKPRDETELTSSRKVAGQEVGGIDEVKPTFIAAEIVALTLDNLVNDVVNRSEGIAEPETDKDEPSTEDLKHTQEVAKIDGHEVISICDDSDESNSVSDFDKVKDMAIAESKDVKDETLSNDSSPPTSDNSDTKDESGEDKEAKTSDLNSLVVNEKDDSNTLPEATSKPKAANFNTVEEPPRRPKRSTVQKAEEIASAKKMKLNNSSEGLPNTVRSLSKENLNPAQKRGSASEVKDDAKKPRTELTRRPKGMSNLDRAIARVASGEASTRSQEITTLISQLASKSLESITLPQLEDIILYKIGRFMVEESECASYRKEAALLRADVDKWQALALNMSKQVRDLESVMKRMITDIRLVNKDALPIPPKVNRSVGLQVGDGRITPEQRKLAIPRTPIPPTPQGPATRRSGLMTNRPILPETDTTPATATATVTSVGRSRSSMSAVSPPKRMAPPLAPPAAPLSPAHRSRSVLLPSNTSPKPGSAGPATGGPTRRSAASSVGQTPPGALIDLTEGDDISPPIQTAPTVTTRHAASSKVRVINPVNTTAATSTTAVATATKPGSIRLVTQSSLPGLTNGATVAQRPTASQSRQVVFSTNVSPANRGVQPSMRTTTYVAAGRPGPGSVIKPRAVNVERKVLHPAPLPPSPASPTPGPGWKKSPPYPELKISKCDKRSRSGGDSGIILSWKMDSLGAEHDNIKSYQLYAYQETASEPSTTMWKKVGEVTAMALPMACTLTQFTEGNKYHFAVRAVDIRGRIGPFSRPGNILLAAGFND